MRKKCGVTSKVTFYLLLTDGSDSRDKPKLYRLQLSVTEVGTDKFDDSSIQVRVGRPLSVAFCESHLSVGGSRWERMNKWVNTKDYILV